MELKRLLTRQGAADYCSISIPTFEALCPIPPICLGDNKRLARWDKKALDIWIDQLSGFASPDQITDEEFMRGRGNPPVEPHETDDEFLAPLRASLAAAKAKRRPKGGRS